MHVIEQIMILETIQNRIRSTFGNWPNDIPVIDEWIAIRQQLEDDFGWIRSDFLDASKSNIDLLDNIIKRLEADETPELTDVIHLYLGIESAIGSRKTELHWNY